MNPNDEMSVEQILLEILPPQLRGVVNPNGIREDHDTNKSRRDEALAALNKLRREDMEFVIGEHEKNNYGGIGYTTIKDHRNALRTEQTARMNQRLSGEKE